MEPIIIKTIKSADAFMKIDITEKNGLFRIAVLVQILTYDGKLGYTPICSTSASIFGCIEDAEVEGKRFIDKYEESPQLFKS